MTRLHIHTDIIDISLDHKEFNRIMGFTPVLPTPFEEAFKKVSTMLETGIARAEVVIFDNDEVIFQQDQVVIKGVVFQIGEKVISYFENCDRAALFICTLGTEFENRMNSFRVDPVEAYFADTIGSLLCESFADLVHQRILAEVKKRGFTTTNRYSPGYCNWEVSGQQPLFSFFKETLTGIILNSSSLMLPIKSISGIVGIGKQIKQTPYLCNICTDPFCAYRRTKIK